MVYITSLVNFVDIMYYQDLHNLLFDYLMCCSTVLLGHYHNPIRDVFAHCLYLQH